MANVTITKTTAGNVDLVISQHFTITISNKLNFYTHNDRVCFFLDGKSYSINLGDTITINGSLFTGNAIALKNAIEALLP